MSDYINITRATTRRAQIYVDTHWTNSKKSGVKRHVLSRGAHLLLAPAFLATTALDTIVGLGSGLGMAVPCMSPGSRKRILGFSSRHTSMSNRLLVFPYQNFLKAVNPKAQFGNEEKLFFSRMVAPLAKTAVSCQKSNNFLKREVGTRLIAPVLLVACLVTRAVDGVISVPIVLVSFLTLGKLRPINNLACQTLKTPGIINDLFLIVALLIVPNSVDLMA